ncbi:hypothetical protein [Streptosporangium sp. CA-115845]|uniref:hypothetical protein n=1 Tax=Streptosporangium sp. CA-115845 TaxID=3240071 RepID=UPI003D8F99B7
MVRWRSGLRRSLAVSALCLVGGALVALPSEAADAGNAELVVDYSCTGGVALNGAVKLRTKVSIPTTLTVGEPLNIGWALDYEGASRFGSPAYFAPGGKATVTGDVQLTGSWTGVLQPKGSVDQPGQLQPGTPLELPKGISDSAHTSKEGTVRVTPQKLYVDFTPPAGEVMVNDDDPRVKYHAQADWDDVNDQPMNNNDYHHDLHRTNRVNSWASFTFTGTGIEYVAQRDQGAGKVGFKIDGQPASPAYIDASENEDGTPTNDAHRGGLTLWSFRGLEYGTHTIDVTNLENGTWTQVDAFRVITKQLVDPPQGYRATCSLISAPVAVDVTISKAGGSQSPNPTGPGTGSPSPTVTPTTPTPTPTNTRTGTPTPSHTGTTTPPANGVNSTSTTTTTSTPKPTLTVTATVTPTRPTPTAPQVIITPSGGAQTGEAPQGGSGLGLLGAGTVMVTGSALGGVALMRRRAAHARGQRDS